MQISFAEDISLHNSLSLPKEVLFDFSFRERFENADWIGDENQSYGHSKAQLGLGYEKDIFKVYLQGQYSGLYGLDSDSNGIDSAYYANNNSHKSSNDFFIRQGYLKLSSTTADGNINATFGRFLFSSGAEKVAENPNLAWLQQKRVAERLIGAFDFTFGRSFDGINLGVKGLNASYLRPTEGGFTTNGFNELEHVNLVTSSYSSNTKFANSPGHAQFFYYNYTDSRNNINKTDNRPTESLNADRSNINIHTFGGHWIQLYRKSNMTFDSTFWGVLQSGDWGNQDHLAAAAIAETGVHFDKINWTPWLRAGWNWGSGDNSSKDNDHNTFFQILPTVRTYALTPYFNMMNNHDIFTQLIIQPRQNITLRSDLHYLLLANRNDLLYSGAGAAKDKSFGYNGVSSNNENEIGTLLDVSISYSLSQNITTNLYYGHLFGSEIQTATDKDIDYLFLEMMLKI